TALRPLRPSAAANTPAPVGPVDGTTDAGDTPTDDSPAATAEPTSADSPTTTALRPLRPSAAANTPAPVGPVDGTTGAGDTPSDGCAAIGRAVDASAFPAIVGASNPVGPAGGAAGAGDSPTGGRPATTAGPASADAPSPLRKGADADAPNPGGSTSSTGDAGHAPAGGCGVDASVWAAVDGGIPAGADD
ncbi:hypothetical protein ACWC0C_13555, partial [Streptomyces sp. NPDC001709]